MSIQIIDGFQVNTALPIDNRIVASGSAARNAIPYKYHGLRVFDISDSIPYVWNGSTWVSENASGIAGSGTVNYIPLYTSGNIISDSYLYQDNINEDIRTSDIGSGAGLVQISPYGTVLANNGFFGPANGITNIIGANINNGSIPVSGAGSKLINGSTGQVLVSGVANPSWTNQSLLSVGTASSSLNSNINRTTTGGTHYLTFVGAGAWSSGAGAGISNEVIKSNSLDLTYVPSSRTLSVGTISVSVTNTQRIISPNLPAIAHIGGLSSTAGSVINHMFVSATSSNANRLEINTIRQSSGTNWFTSAHRIQSRVDNDYMGYIQFNGTNLDTGIALGTGYQGLTASGVFSGGSNPYERMRIDGIGRIMMNTTSSISGGCVLNVKSTSSLYDGLVHQAWDNSYNIFEFKNSSGTQRGRIYGNGSSGVVYSTSSDRRLKTNIEDMPTMYDVIKNLKPSKFNWKIDNKEDYGFIAQDVYRVIPNLRGEISYCDVNKEGFDIENPVKIDGEEYYYGLDYGKLTPYLTKALQETMEKLETLTNKIKNANSLEELKSSL